MARFFEEEAKHAIEGQRVLELASGTGILGLLVGVMGAKSVMMTDKASMVALLEENIEENRDILRSEVQCGSLDWLDAIADPQVLAAAPFDAIIMSDVIYEEEIVIPLVNTLRRLCRMNATMSGDQPMNHVLPIYLCASHRAERIEDMFFTSASPWFSCRELTLTVRQPLRGLLNKDAIAIWVLQARETLVPHLVDGIGELRQRGAEVQGDKVEAEGRREVVEGAGPCHFESRVDSKVCVVATMQPSADGISKCVAGVQFEECTVHRRVGVGAGQGSGAGREHEARFLPHAPEKLSWCAQEAEQLSSLSPRSPTHTLQERRCADLDGQQDFSQATRPHDSVETLAKHADAQGGAATATGLQARARHRDRTSGSHASHGDRTENKSRVDLEELD